MFALPVTLNAPPVTKLAPVILPVAVTIAVPILPTLALPVTDRTPPVTKLAPVILPFATTALLAFKLKTLALPLIVTKLPTLLNVNASLAPALP